MTTTTGVLPPPVLQQFSEKMLSTPMRRNIHSIFAIPRVMTATDGSVVRMRRYNRLATAPVPVNPAFNNPPAQLLTALDIDARLNWYATQIVITREVTAVNQDPKMYGVIKPLVIDLETYDMQKAA